MGNITVTQTMAIMSQVTDPFPSSPLDGLLGLAFDALAQPSSDDAKPWLSAAQQGAGGAGEPCSVVSGQGVVRRC